MSTSARRPRSRSPSSSVTRSASSPSRSERVEPLLERMPLLEDSTSLDRRARRLEERPRHSCLGVGADVRGVAELLGLLDLARSRTSVSSTTTRSLLTRAISATAAAMSSKWCGAIRHDDEVEGAVGERQVLGAADHVRLHPRRRIGADDLEPGLAQPARHVAAAGGDVERGLGAFGPARRSGRDPRPRAARARSRYGLGALRPASAHRGQLHGACARRPASSPRRTGPRAPPRPGPSGPPRRSCRRAGRRSAARSSSARAP